MWSEPFFSNVTLLPGWVVYWVVGPLDVVCLRQWMEIGWSTMKSLLITSHSLGQSRAILCRTNSTTWDHSSVQSVTSAHGPSYIHFTRVTFPVKLRAAHLVWFGFDLTSLWQTRTIFWSYNSWSFCLFRPMLSHWVLGLVWVTMGSVPLPYSFCQKYTFLD